MRALSTPSILMRTCLICSMTWMTSSRTPGTDEEVAAAAAALRPELLATIGVVAVAFLSWMMRAKPF